MPNVDEQLLNRKLAEWAGFYKVEPEMSIGWWKPDGRHEGSKLPNFVQSLDACFKWLAPNLLSVILSYVGEIGYMCIIEKTIENRASVSDKSPSLAFSLAVEQTIDNTK